MAAMRRCLPKKHIPMLFQTCGELGLSLTTSRYLERALSWSAWSCMMLAAAMTVLVFFMSSCSDFARSCRALSLFSDRRYSRPSVVKMSGFCARGAAKAHAGTKARGLGLSHFSKLKEAVQASNEH